MKNTMTHTNQTITTRQLVDLTWAIEAVIVEDHIIDTHEEEISCDANGEPVMETWYQSYVPGICVLRSTERPGITYTIRWQANGGEETLGDAFDFTIEINPNGDDELDTGSLEIVDKEGDPVSPSAVREIGNAIEMSVAWEHEVQSHLPAW